MSDFASNILFTLVARELARQGLIAPGGTPAPTRGTVEKARKSSLLAAVHAAHGGLPILRIGEGIRTAGPEPTLQALRQASGPMDLLLRWQRLERYVHSAHGIALREAGTHHMVLEHVSRRAGEAPHQSEDLLILGVLVALLDTIGTRGLSAALVDAGAARTVYDDRGFHDPADAATACWRIDWHQVQAVPARAHGDGDLPFPASGDDAAVAARLTALVMADCARSWTLAAMARRLGESTRTLQRRLAAAGTGFGALVRTAQIRKASALLLEGRLSVAEVGLLCGFSDQAHFTREFKRRTNIPPARYRADFAGTTAGAAA